MSLGKEAVAHWKEVVGKIHWDLLEAAAVKIS